jgi:hypothetical protein
MFSCKEQASNDTIKISESKEQGHPKLILTKAGVEKIRNILKKYKLGKFYDYTQYIFCKVTGEEFPRLKRQDEERAKEMFKQIVALFEKYRPENRSNLLNYECILYKILQLLGYKEYANRCHLLNNRAKRDEIDRIWEKICNECDWTFYPLP